MEVSVNATSNGAAPIAGLGRYEKSATGGTSEVVTTIKSVFTIVLLPPSFVAVNLTEYVPGTVNVTNGFWSVEI